MIKSFSKLSVFLLAIFCVQTGAFFSCSFAMAREVIQKPLRLAVLNFDRVIQEAAVTAYIQKTVDERRSALQQDVEGYENELRKEETALKDLENKNDPSFDTARKIFENKVTDIQKRLSGRTKILEKAFHDARSRVVQHVMKLVRNLAEEEGFTLVIPKNIVMYQEKGYEITDRILERLNRDMPTIQIQFPGRA